VRYYRLEDKRFAGIVNEDGDPGPSSLRVVTYEFTLVRRTPKGAWIRPVYGEPRFVRDAAKKRFACPSLEEAKASFRARKRRQIRILEARLRDARRSIDIVDGKEGPFYDL
jgi:hypothetical protein